MTDRKHKLIACLLVLGSLCSIVVAAEPNTPAPKITFEDGTVDWDTYAGHGSVGTTHTAGITFKKPRGTSPPSLKFTDADLLRYLRQQKDLPFSEEQRAYWSDSDFLISLTWPNTRLTGDNIHQNDRSYDSVLLYGVSRTDAENMAKAFLRFMAQVHHESIEHWQNMVDTTSKEIETVKEQIAKHKEQLQNAAPQLDSLQKHVPYRTADEATAAIAELNRALNATRIELAGLEARMKAIQDHLQTGRQPFSDAVKSKLEVMLVEAFVARQSGEARMGMAEALNRQAKEFVDLKEVVENARKWIQRDEGPRLSDPERGLIACLRRHKDSLAAAQKAELPKVLDNTVFIYPVAETDN